MNNYKLGSYNTLSILEFGEHGAILDAGKDRILMPKKYVPTDAKIGDAVQVFVYLDQEDRLVATTEHALAEVGQYAFLRVSWVNKYGAFLHWGLTKDLFVPYREQSRRMVKDASYLVYIYVDDKSGRIVATSKLDRYVQLTAEGYTNGQTVDIQVWKQTDMGFKVIVDNCYAGLLYKNEIFKKLYVGDKMQAVVKQVRPDGKLDIALQHDGKQLVEDFSTQLLQQLNEAGGFLPYTDNSSPDEISAAFGVSKKAFKKTVGALYKQRIIAIEEQGIHLVQKK